VLLLCRYCPKCKSHQEAIKQMSPWKLPKILIIQLKRFTYQNCIWKDKISKDVSFPLRLVAYKYHAGMIHTTKHFMFVFVNICKCELSARYVNN